MLRSLKLYIANSARIILRPERRLVWLDLRRFFLEGENHAKPNGISHEPYDQSLRAGVDWLLNTQKATFDKGFCSYHLARGWSSTYPETTGYIIPTLIHYSLKYSNPAIADAAMAAADFLLSIQKGSGGWQGGRMNENKPEIVFNTGQVIRGMLAAYEYSGDSKYLGSAKRAGDWLVSIQHPEGFWKKHALMGQERVYDTFVDVPLIALGRLAGIAKYRESALKNLEWVVDKKMHPNGWFEDCDNTVKRNDRPILHTIAYTLDGLIDSGMMLQEDKYIRAAAAGAGMLKNRFLSSGSLNGRYDKDWNGTEFLICTGGAQMATVWIKLYNAGYGDDFHDAAKRILNYLRFIQMRNTTESHRTFGAVPGSYPVWGRYEPFAYPNWATKFYCDALMLLDDLQQ